MSGSHSDLGPDLRALAQAILDRVDPAVRAAAALAAGRSDSPGKCQQVWCPVCALAALAQGEQHPMLDVVAEHSLALLTIVRAMVDGVGRRPPDGSPEPPQPDGSPPGGYQSIPVIVEE
jgi:hypothetical protein